MFNSMNFEEVLTLQLWCSVKGHAYLNKPVSFQLQVCFSMYDPLVDTRYEKVKLKVQNWKVQFIKSILSIDENPLNAP